MTLCIRRYQESSFQDPVSPAAHIRQARLRACHNLCRLPVSASTLLKVSATKMARNKATKLNGGAAGNDDHGLQQYVDTNGHFSMVRYGTNSMLLSQSMLNGRV